MLNRWSMWGFIITRAAKAYGFMDPRALFSRIQRFSRPSEVWVPAELLRSGMALQARGLLNSQAIQNNLDWVWPYWVYRQFDPTDAAFIPRAFNLTHINLSHRNWTGLGVPDYGEYALVDPRGLVTPLFDGWSLDAWIVCESGRCLIPPQQHDVDQRLHMVPRLSVTTVAQAKGMALFSEAEVGVEGGSPACRIKYRARAGERGWLLVCVRPYNPEGVSLIDTVARLRGPQGWMVNGRSRVLLEQTPASYVFSNYQLGDLLRHIPALGEQGHHFEDRDIHCPVGMATAAAVYPLMPHESFEVAVHVPLAPLPLRAVTVWDEHMRGSCALQVPDRHFQFLFDAAMRTVVLYAPQDVYPGPYTYKRFWFRDAAFIIYAMAALGLTHNLPKVVASFPKRQTPLGYFESQDGEWDSNGQAMWAVERYATLTGARVTDDLTASLERAVQWIRRKRISRRQQSGDAGLLPAGFSAEHFGPSDVYYWDDYWSVAGLEAVSALCRRERPDVSRAAMAEAADLRAAIDLSLTAVAEHWERPGIPASPYRRMDAGAIGALAASYPLQLYAAEDHRILGTVDFLMRRYMLDGAYYHELSHSGINVYLTLQLAQVLLRAGDERFLGLVARVAELASPTGQWPEAIHPRTGGGCMGDGQHVWAAAEWLLMLRNMFVREEEAEGKLVLCSGIPLAWLKQGRGELRFGPTNTTFGPVSVRISGGKDISVSWDAAWRGPAPRIEVRLPCHDIQVVEAGGRSSVHMLPCGVLKG